MNATVEPIAQKAAVLGQLDEMREQYLNTPLADIDHATLADWKPETSLWQRLQPLMGLQSGLKRRKVLIGDHNVCYWAGGNSAGQVVVLLHGFGASKENWSYLAAKLRRDYYLLVPDLAGFGDSDFKPTADYRMAAQADRIAAFLQALGVEKSHVAGSSMGGAIAAQLASRHPKLVDTLCLMNAAGAPAKYLSQLESGLAAGVNYLSPSVPRDTFKVFEIAFHRRHRLLGLVLSLFMAGAMSHRKRVNDFIFSHLVDSLKDTYLSLPEITAPTLVLWGDSDQVLNVSCADQFCEQIPSAKAMILPEVGHLPMIEEPDLTARVVTDFWRARTKVD
ncbi:Lipase 1 [Zhongshania aliphaticivorans]|uniref:Lipase 1 n=1 Tax=Zhongshania aliphaticivorans TaxID=1470434 RepID=A0A5S9NDB1_9GAMM|nr:alpha/beta hydrolase [Zhongshania aliphaticivorans]CAA0087303.1 Lipase 1 [Zhongshania aliphaticivorans]CAA0114501.1 Lipase 1 [Zhongshania aliphaticivorans]